jgi:hypothetical protein
MLAASSLKALPLPESNEISSEEGGRKRAEDMIRDSIHLTAIQPPVKEIQIKKNKRWWQIWR